MSLNYQRTSASDEKLGFRVRILKILLAPPHGTDLSVRQIAKKLDTTSSHVFYYLQKMCEEGILTKEMEGERGFYKPQPIFGRDTPETMRLLLLMSENVEDPTTDKVSNCIKAFIQLFGMLFKKD